MHSPFTLSSSSANSRLPQVPNPSVAALYEDALVYETGSAITSTGALTAYSGAKTGRSPLDKRIVKEPGSENDIWWGYAYPICPAIAMDSILTAHRPVNKPMTPDVRLHSYSAFRSRGHTVASAAGPMTAAILLTKLHSSLSDPMIINFTTLSQLLLRIVAQLHSFSP
jgi:hypothetical protein